LIVYQLILELFPIAGVKILGYKANIKVEDVIFLTNKKRMENNIPTLKESPLLAEAARRKGEDMLAKGYWAHVAPDGTEPWKFFSDVGYKYKYAGENLARDFPDSVSAVEAWMASPSHKENLLSPKYTEIGVAVVEGYLNGVEATIIVQLFGTPTSQNQALLPVARTTQNVVAPAPTQIQASTPTPTLTPISTPPTTAPNYNAFVSQAKKLDENIKTKEEKPDTSNFKILISPFQTTRGLAVILTLTLSIVLTVDELVVFRKKIPRATGRTLAHLAFLGMVLSILLIARAGEIL